MQIKKIRIRNVIHYIGIAIGLALLLIQARNGIIGILDKSITIVSPLWIFISILINITAISLQMMIWDIIMHGLQIRLSLFDVFTGYLISFLPRYIPGTVWGYLSRSEWLFQEHRVTYAIANWGSVLEIISSIVANLLLIVSYAIFNDHLVLGYKIILFLLVFIFLPYVTWFGIQDLGQKISHKFVFLRKYSGLNLPKISYSRWCLSIALNLGIWILFGLILMAATNSLNAQPYRFSLLQLLKFSESFSFAWLVGFIVVIAPSGLGFREIALAALLMTNIGMAFFTATIVAIGSRIIIIISELFLVAISFLCKAFIIPIKKG